MLDVAATRARLRSAVAPTSPMAPSGYRDADVTPPPDRGPMHGARTSPVAAHGSSQTRTPPTEAMPPADPTRFLDLDAAPLTLANGANAGAVPPPEDPGGGETDVTLAPVADPAPPIEAPLSLDPPLMRRIIFHATADPGTAPPFGKTQPNLGGEGLRYGIGRFTQASGELGQLLTAMRDMDATAFDSVFGPDAQDLLAVANAPRPVEVRDGELPNMAPVGGQPLWSPDWIARFKAAAQHPAFQDAQYMVAAQTALLPVLEFARDMGLHSEKALTILAERAIQLGIEQAKAFVATAAGPLHTEALKRAALVHVSDDPARATLSDFQSRQGLPDTAGRLDPDSHAALFAALRVGGDSPVPLPSPEMMLDQIASAAEASPMPGRVAAIRANQTLSEAPLSHTDPVME